MKFIHLSDLHLGKRVNEYSMLEDQEYILKKIINIVDAEKPDGVIIAGDVYDKSVPAAEAVQLFDNFLVQLAKRKLEVFVISGNHDSPERIAFGSRIMDAAKALHTRIESNTKVLANIRAKVGDLDTLEKRYTWLKALSNTANGNISGKEMKALSGLADGHRLVGIISHVADLKNRIDKQIVVTKEKSGGSKAQIIL